MPRRTPGYASRAGATCCFRSFICRAALNFQVDDGKATDLQIQTCENRGCYAGSAIAPDLLAALRTGKQLKVSFQNLGKENITIPIPLTDFAAAYDRIK